MVNRQLVQDSDLTYHLAMAIQLCKGVKPQDCYRWYYGFCWCRPEYGDILVAVIPLNLLMRLWIAVIFWLRHPFRKLDSPITYTQLLGEINKLGMAVMDEKFKRKAADILLDATRKHVSTQKETILTLEKAARQSESFWGGAKAGQDALIDDLRARIKELEACQKPQTTPTDGSC